MNGWVKLHRRFAEWEWSDEPNMVSFFIHLLLAASNRDTRWKGLELKRGQVLFGRKKWSKKTGISEQGLRTCIKKLKSTNEITTYSTKRFTIITIVNYDKYQSNGRSQQPTDQPTDQPTTNQQVTNHQPHRKKVRRKEGKEEKKEQRETEPKVEEPLF